MTSSHARDISGLSTRRASTLCNNNIARIDGRGVVLVSHKVENRYEERSKSRVITNGSKHVGLEQFHTASTLTFHTLLNVLYLIIVVIATVVINARLIVEKSVGLVAVIQGCWSYLCLSVIRTVRQLFRIPGCNINTSGGGNIEYPSEKIRSATSDSLVYRRLTPKQMAVANIQTILECVAGLRRVMKVSSKLVFEGQSS